MLRSPSQATLCRSLRRSRRKLSEWPHRGEWSGAHQTQSPLGVEAAREHDLGDAESGSFRRDAILGQNPLHDVTVNIGQTITAALELVSQSLMIDAEQMHDRGMQIMNVQAV